MKPDTDREKNKWKWIAVGAAAAHAAYVNVRRKVMLEDNSIDVSDDGEGAEEYDRKGRFHE